jgi:hypothetical protein
MVIGLLILIFLVLLLGRKGFLWALLGVFLLPFLILDHPGSHPKSDQSARELRVIKHDEIDPQTDPDRHPKHRQNLLQCKEQAGDPRLQAFARRIGYAELELCAYLKEHPEKMAEILRAANQPPPLGPPPPSKSNSEGSLFELCQLLGGTTNLFWNRGSGCESLIGVR